MTCIPVGLRTAYSQKNPQTHVPKDHRGHNVVMVTHSNVTLEDFVVPAQSLRPPRQLRLTQGWDGGVRDAIFGDANVGGDRSSYERVHSVVAELFEHVCSLSGIRTNVSVREGVESGEG